ncbi:unnamed protein product [Adineta steineri]|uniref:Transmembrane protein n=2 Tax=Adineta steineri TaxID=433720 RepID=A0A819U246_9BILA|nr:unnamed protein product [Adineta steineri]
MNLSTRQTIESIKYWLQMMIPSLTMFIFIGFAFCMASMIVLSIIPIYIENKSVEKTNFVLTTVRMDNYTLYMSRALGKRDLTSSLTNNLTLDQAQMITNISIQYALEQQLKASDNRDQFNISILDMTSNTSDTTNMSVTLDFLIVYTRECISCDKLRQLNIFQGLGSNNQLSTRINFFIQYSNLSYILSDPTIVYTPNIPIQNIIIITKIVSKSQFISQIDNSATNQSTQISNKFLANNYTLIVTTSKSNYFATLDEALTQNSANQNDGPVSFQGAMTMYSELPQIIERQIQFTNGSNALNITINHVTLQFWYLNSTIHVIVDFLVNYSTSCDNQCMNQRSNQLINQLSNITTTSIYIQLANLTDGQVSILKNNVYVLYNYSLTTQIISNISGTIIQTIPPMFTIV